MNGNLKMKELYRICPMCKNRSFVSRQKFVYMQAKTLPMMKNSISSNKTR